MAGPAFLGDGEGVLGAALAATEGAARSPSARRSTSQKTSARCCCWCRRRKAARSKRELRYCSLGAAGEQPEGIPAAALTAPHLPRALGRQGAPAAPTLRRSRRAFSQPGPGCRDDRCAAYLPLWVLEVVAGVRRRGERERGARLRVRSRWAWPSAPARDGKGDSSLMRFGPAVHARLPP